MLAISTGKLVRYLVEDGGHIAADAPYAEVEVMKMMMTLLAPASGEVAAERPDPWAQAWVQSGELAQRVCRLDVPHGEPARGCVDWRSLWACTPAAAPYPGSRLRPLPVQARCTSSCLRGQC